MIVDASALIAILVQEPGEESLRRLIGRESRPAGIGAPSLVEAGTVAAARIPGTGRLLLERLVLALALEAVPFTEEHWPVAITAFERYGKGRHPAALNFGDCLTYAVAKVADEPLLCVGEDFVQTDLTVLRP